MTTIRLFEPHDCLRCGAPMVRTRRIGGRPTGWAACLECLCRRLVNGGSTARIHYRKSRAHDRTDLRRWLRWRALRGLPV